MKKAVVDLINIILTIKILIISFCMYAVEITRNDYPRPCGVREEWLNLNGEWEFVETDDDNAMYLDTGAEYPDRIIVPFCRESVLSGLNRKGFVRNVWYRRRFTIPENWMDRRVLLHIGACDWRTRVWVNGQLVGEHYGGSAPITCDVTTALKEGENTVIVHAFDDVRSGVQARGKQSDRLESYGCVYTRTMGIWQTVWLEPVGRSYIHKFRFYPDPESKKVKAMIFCRGDLPAGLSVSMDVWYEGELVGTGKGHIHGDTVVLEVPLSKVFLWEPGAPNLYDVKLSLKQDGTELDRVSSYFGIRTITLTGRKFLINGKPIFQRLVLDQGFYPDGIWTAPSDEALRADIERSMRAGFNGARLHQKVFEPRFLYWADKLGYLVWGEFPDWGLDYRNPAGYEHVINEWREILERDFNHPSIIGWCPFNETPKDAVLLQKVVFELTRAVDTTRPILEASGWTHGYYQPMLIDAHDYDQNPASFKERWDKIIAEPKRPDCPYAETRVVPFFISEYGGIGWDIKEGGWGYGDRPKTLEEFYQRLEGLTKAILDNPYIFGFCYTQLYDIEQEQNGIYTYDRTPKFDLERIRGIFTAESAYEKAGN